MLLRDGLFTELKDYGFMTHRSCVAIKYSIKDMHQLASKYGAQSLFAGYIYSKTSLIWQCTDGHRPFEVTFNNLDETVK